MNAQEMRFGGRFHMDDRGIRYCDIFPEIEKGDINVSIIEPGAAALWHRHMHQDDYQIVIKGNLKVGVCNAPYMDIDDLQHYVDEETAKNILEERQGHLSQWKKLREDGIEKQPLLKEWPEDEGVCQWFYMSERSACHGPLFIPRYLWHGCYNYTNEQAILIYHITEKYDGTDEERMDPNLALWDYERVNK